MRIIGAHGRGEQSIEAFLRLVALEFTTMKRNCRRRLADILRGFLLGWFSPMQCRPTAAEQRRHNQPVPVVFVFDQHFTHLDRV